MSEAAKKSSRVRYEPGDVIPGPDLHVVKQLGSGGQGEVYLAWSDYSQARCVIKLLNAELVGRAAENLFRKEVRLMVQLVHPHIVRVLDGKWTREEVPRPYYTMHEEPGAVPLAELLHKRTPFGLAQILEIIFEVTDALDYVHTLSGPDGVPLGAIHRDLKPGNILLVRSRGGTVVKLLDFGIAFALKRTLDGERDRLFHGTFAYAAPEQHEGVALPQSDIYALGVLFYELLAGRHPYWDATDIKDLVACHRHIRPRPISLYRANVPERVTELVTRMLEKDPAKRPGSAYALRAELRSCMDFVAKLAREERQQSPTDHDTTEEMRVEKLLDRRRVEHDECVTHTVAIIHERTGAAEGPAGVWYRTDPGFGAAREAARVVREEVEAEAAKAKASAEASSPSPSFDAWGPTPRTPEGAGRPLIAAAPTAPSEAPPPAGGVVAPVLRRAAEAPRVEIVNVASPAPPRTQSPSAGSPVREQARPHESPRPSEVSRMRHAETNVPRSMHIPPPTERELAEAEVAARSRARRPPTGTVPMSPALRIDLPSTGVVKEPARGAKGGTLPMTGAYKHRRADLTSVTLARVLIALIAVTMIAAVALILYKQQHAPPATKGAGGETR